VTWLAKWRRRRTEPAVPPGMFTIKQVGDACGLPGPVIMQWVPRTWVDDAGWMFTAEQLREAVTIAARWQQSRAANESLRQQDDSTDVIVCDGCGGVAIVDDAAWPLWLHLEQPDSSVHSDPVGRDYCPDCVMPCPSCTIRTAGVCGECFGAGRVPKPTGPRSA
jgi:hypothetical protein